MAALYPGNVSPSPSRAGRRGCAHHPNHRPLRSAPGATTRLGGFQGRARATPSSSARSIRCWGWCWRAQCSAIRCCRCSRWPRALPCWARSRHSGSMNSAAAARPANPRQPGMRSRCCARPHSAPCSALGTLLLALFVTWVATAQAIYVAAFGYQSAADIPDFAGRVLTTPQGWWLIVVGCGVGLPVCPGGAVRQRGLVPADARSSCRCRRRHGDIAAGGGRESRSDGGMGMIVALLLVLGSLPLFLGLAVVIPLLRHATWHLYRKVNRAGSRSAADFARPHRERRPAGDFPADLVSMALAGSLQPAGDFQRKQAGGRSSAGGLLSEITRFFTVRAWRNRPVRHVPGFAPWFAKDISNCRETSSLQNYRVAVPMTPICLSEPSR